MDLYSKIKSGHFVIAGPCVVEDQSIMEEIAEECAAVCEKYGLLYIFKASFDKANRTSISSYRGDGISKGLEVLNNIKSKFNLPLTTDIHESGQASIVSKVVDILQIPAFLCRQTDLLVAAAETGKIVNIKKAQFLSGEEMAHPVAKVKNSGNDKIMLTERGTMFGYNNLVVDIRNLVDMATFGYPIVMDVTHSTQKPGALGGKSGGDSKYAPIIARATAAVGVNGHFFEVHPDPSKALSDGPNMIKLKDFDSVLKDVVKYTYK